MRKIIFWSHLISGITAGAVILIMSFTGVLLSFEPQIVKWSERSLRRVDPPSSGARLSVDEVVTRVSESRGGKLPSGILIRKDPKTAWTLMFGRGDEVYVDPYSSGILGKPSKAKDFLHWVEDIHRRLGAKDAGRRITGIVVAAFVFMIVSGFYLWWPRRWTLPGVKRVVLFDGKLKGRARDWNWHNVIGFWCAPVLLVTALTGTIMAHEWANALLLRAAGGEKPLLEARLGARSGPEAKRVAGSTPQRSGVRGGGRGDDRPSVMPPAGLEAVFQAAIQKCDAWSSVNIRLGQDSRAPLKVFVMERGGFLDLRSQATVDGTTGRLILWEPFAEQSRGKRWRFWARYLHTGEIWGPFGQFLNALAALGAVFLVCTGFSLALNRFNHWRAVRAKR